MSAGEVVDLEPGQGVVYVDDMPLCFVTHSVDYGVMTASESNFVNAQKEQPLATMLEDLRALVADGEVLKRSTYSDHCVARVLDHVEQLHATIRQLADVVGADPAGFGAGMVRLIYRQLAAFESPKA